MSQVPEMPATPELDKARAVGDKSRLIGDFLVHSGYVLCERIDCSEEYHEQVGWSQCTDGHHLVPVHRPIEQVLAEYFDIDYKALEAERAELLKYIGQ